jgi:DNA-binding CsgD family transcriptional regulator
VIRTEEEHLAHYGILRRSGRYPWGSGGTENIRNKTYLETIDSLKKHGMTEAEIARSFGFTTTELRAARSVALAQQTQARITQTERLKAKGMSNSAIARRQGRAESSVRADLAPGRKDRADALMTTANMLKDQVDKNNYVMVGRGVDAQLGITQSRLNNALAALKEQGYEVHVIQTEQLGTGKYTNVKVLAKPGTTRSEVQRNREQIQVPFSYSEDGGRSFFHTQPPIAVSPKRLKVNYAEDGGGELDGLIYVRPGVKDLSLGGNNYGQVRIQVGSTHYLKGMAIYKEDLPPGVDLVFNTKKSVKEGWKTDSNKLSDDSDLPFGSIIRQIHGPDGKVTSALNIVGTKEESGVEGYWESWSKSLASQMLSKQPPDLARQQLGITYSRRVRELKEINSLTNPIVKKKLLLGFADSTDSAAVHLRAAAMHKQSTKVILPISSMKPGEVYARGFRDGERVVLIRYPHGGRFEIPELTVNNRNREARKLLGPASDAIGIHHSVAQRLSGADFDGDTVLIIPNRKGEIKTAPALEGLKDFDPMIYKLPKNSPIKRMTDSEKGIQMGSVSNLITDMTLHQANNEDLARAIKHSMVVIDAKKHNLNWRQSAIDNNIPELKERYQRGRTSGASTLISRGSAKVYINQRRERPASRGGPIDPVTGKRVYEETGRTYTRYKYVPDPKDSSKQIRVPVGKPIPYKTRVKRLAVTEDARTLSSGTVMEGIYADHSNRLKAMANGARKEALTLKGVPSSSSAKKVYAKEVASLNEKLIRAKRNAPLEAHAQLIANNQVNLKRRANPDIEKDELTKIRIYALTEARARVGAHKTDIQITQNEWDAIQAGAISKSKLEEILTNTDLEIIKQYALPKHVSVLSSNDLARARQMLDSGYTQEEIADHLGVGLTTLKTGLTE